MFNHDKNSDRYDQSLLIRSFLTGFFLLYVFLQNIAWNACGINWPFLVKDSRFQNRSLYEYWSSCMCRTGTSDSSLSSKAFAADPDRYARYRWREEGERIIPLNSTGAITLYSGFTITSLSAFKMGKVCPAGPGIICEEWERWTAPGN